MLTFFFHELKRSLKSTLIWAISVSAFVVMCISIFPGMQASMNAEVGKLYQSLGGFTAAFGLDKLLITDLLNFYGLECGTVIAVGGGLFAALAAITALSKEESNRTAEFLFTHPVCRLSINLQKFMAIVTRLVLFNFIVISVALISIQMLGENVNMSTFFLYHLALGLLMLQIAMITFGLSAFLKKDNISLGVGLAIGLYFLNIIINLKKDLDFLKFLTPYYYAEASRVLVDNKIDWPVLAIQMASTVVFLIVALTWYSHRDLNS